VKPIACQDKGKEERYIENYEVCFFNKFYIQKCESWHSQATSYYLFSWRQGRGLKRNLVITQKLILFFLLLLVFESGF